MNNISYYWNRFTDSTLCELVALFGTKISEPEIYIEYRERIFNQWRTFWLFFGQILSASRSCREILKKAQMWLSFFPPDEKKISSNTAGYCKARQRLDPDYIDDIQRQVRDYYQQDRLISDKHLLNGRPVKVVDGTSVSMPDTEDNQKLYPQPGGQKKGCGFPVMKLVVSFCLTTAIILSSRKGELKCSERTLWHDMWTCGMIIKLAMWYWPIVASVLLPTMRCFPAKASTV